MTAPMTKPDRRKGCRCVYERGGETYIGCQLDLCLCPVHHQGGRE